MPSLIQNLEVSPQELIEATHISAHLLKLIELKSIKLFLHSNQVANYAASIAAKMRLPQSEIMRVKKAALLHDLGHLTVPNSVLNKAPYLSVRETSAYKNHCNAGSNMLENIAAYQEIIPYIRHHHEQFDGKGYPKRLKGVNIPLGARIIAVANYYDRFINPCIQHWFKSKEEAVKELRVLSGTAFDPTVVQAFAESLGAAKIDKVNK
jgi:putative nucleotidyltransferase with HDIG domain